MQRVACVIGVVGAPLTGKGLFAHQWIVEGESPLRLAWSPVEHSDNYAGLLGCKTYSRIPTFVAAIKAGARAAVFVPRDVEEAFRDDFTDFCRVVRAVPRVRCLVEELSRVTLPSWAPPAWKNLSTAGSHHGLELMATAQRPAMIDKAFLTGCTEVRCYRMNEAPDARDMEQRLLVPWRELMVMPDRHYWHLIRSPRQLLQGVQPLPGEKKSSPRRARRTP